MRAANLRSGRPRAVVTVPPRRRSSYVRSAPDRSLCSKRRTSSPSPGGSKLRG
ncbi:hypothetical protein [Nannocystis pusilla]|uniref:hypothetical protein n=1 Tax=Nannocystis pusilla TaxID=889268 RepID=UPI003B7F0677